MGCRCREISALDERIKVLSTQCRGLEEKLSEADRQVGETDSWDKLVMLGNNVGNAKLGIDLIRNGISLMSSAKMNIECKKDELEDERGRLSDEDKSYHEEEKRREREARRARNRMTQ